MTVKLLCDYNGYPLGSLYTATAAEETSLIANNQAVSDLTGATTYTPPTPLPRQFDQAIPLASLAALTALAAASGLLANQLYIVGTTWYKANSASTYVRFSTSGNLFNSVPMTSGSTGKRQSFAGANQVVLSGASGSIYYRWVDGSSPTIDVTNADLQVAVNASPSIALDVPASKPILEHLRVGGSDVTWTAGMLN